MRKRVNVKLVNNAEDYVKCVSRPTFVSQKILDKNLVAIHRVKPVLVVLYGIFWRKWSWTFPNFEPLKNS